MKGEANVGISLTLGGTAEYPPPTPTPATEMQSRLRETIDQVRHHASWIDSVAASLESTVSAAVEAAVEARSNELRLAEENNANERLKEKTLELEAKENTFNLRMKNEIELLQLEKEVIVKKLQELEEKEEEFESLGSYVEERAIQVREIEEQMEDRRKEVEAKEKEIEECFRLFQLREKGFEEQLAEFKLKQSEFQVRLTELDARENQFKEIESKLVKRIEEAELREKLLEEERLAEFKLKQSEFQVRLSELNARESRFKELESKLVKRIEEVEVREKLLEEKQKEVKSEAEKLEELKKDVELKEKQQADHSSEANFSICVTMSGKDLQIFVNERSKDGSDSMKDEVEAALKLSPEPAKLVLDAMEGFYPPHLKIGEVEFEEVVIRKSCLMLLEHLTRMSPEIKQTVRKEAMKLACDWMTRMKCDAEHSLEVLALLQLMAAYGLASTFDEDELMARVRVIAHYSQAARLLQDLGLANKISGVIQKLIENKLQDEAYRLVSAFELHNEFPSLSPCSKENLESDAVLVSSDTVPITPDRLMIPQCSGAKRSWTDACADGNQNDYTDLDHATSANLPSQQPEMPNLPHEDPESLTSDHQAGCTNPLLEFHLSEVDEIEKGGKTSLFIPECFEKGGMNLKSLCWKIEKNELHCSEVSACLQLVSDLAEFVLGVVKNPSSFKWKRGNEEEQVRFAFPEHSPLLLMDRMWRMAPQISENTQREALSFAEDWKSKLVAANQIKDENMELVSFVLFLAAYKLDSAFDLHDLFNLFQTSHWCLNLTKLFRAVRFEDLVSKFIAYLLRNKRPRQALQCIHSSSLLENSPSVKKLMSSYIFKRSKMLRNPTTQDDEIGDLSKELQIWKALLTSVSDHYLVDSFKARISFLEKRKANRIRAETASPKAAAVSCATSNASSSSTASQPANKRRKVASSSSLMDGNRRKPVRKFHPPQHPLQFTGSSPVVVPLAIAPNGILFRHLPPPPPGPYPGHVRSSEPF